MQDPYVLTRRAEVGRRLREVRQERGLTQGELSRAVRIGQASLSNYENGKRDLPLAVVVNLAGALGVSLGYLLDVPGITVLRDADIGRAVRALAASPRLLDSVVPPVQAAEDSDEAAAADEGDGEGDADDEGGAADDGDGGPDDEGGAADDGDGGDAGDGGAADDDDRDGDGGNAAPDDGESAAP